MITRRTLLTALLATPIAAHFKAFVQSERAFPRPAFTIGEQWTPADLFASGERGAFFDPSLTDWDGRPFGRAVAPGHFVFDGKDPER